MNKREKEILQAQLNNEKAVLKKLEEMYKEALLEINDKIAILLGRQDADLQHVVYQVEYQKALKTQVQAILENLQAKEFESISEYLANAYEEGFLGTMYDLQGQGIPLIFPIDQEQVLNAIQTQSKLNETLYAALGHDVKDLQKKIAGEISRGIAGGQLYTEIARNIAGYARIPKNNAMRITRTEANRIQNQAISDAQFKAKSKGADIVKIWSAALDKRTRDSHARVDGEIRELEEPFSNGLMKPSDPDGKPEEVINCRCRCNSKARWLLDEPITKWSPDAPIEISDDGTTQYFKIDAKDYQDFKNQYRQATERVRHNAQKMKGNGKDFREHSLRTKDGGSYGVDWETVKSKEYTNRFSTLSDNEKANALAAQRSRNALVNRDRKKTEELYAIDLSSGKDISSITNQHINSGVRRTEKFMNDVRRCEKNGGKPLFIHNHPKGLPPSVADINELLNHQSAVGITVGHDGSIYYYSKPNRKIKKTDFDVAIRKNKEYNGTALYEKAIEELAKQFEFEFKKL